MSPTTTTARADVTLSLLDYGPSEIVHFSQGPDKVPTNFYATSYSTAHGFQRHLLARHFNRHLFIPKDGHGHDVPGVGTDTRVTVKGNGFGPNNNPFVKYDDRYDEGNGFRTDHRYDTVTTLSHPPPPQPIPSVPRSVNLVGNSAFTLTMANVERDVKHVHGWMSHADSPTKPVGAAKSTSGGAGMASLNSETREKYGYKGHLREPRVTKSNVVEVAEFSGTGYTNDASTLVVSQWERDPDRFTNTQGFPIPPANYGLPRLAISKMARDLHAKRALVHMDD
ncbi:hypothetical protein HDU93_000392, partial [Gonapodya sp. JEL0774]